MEIYNLIVQYIDDDGVETLKSGLKYSSNSIGFFSDLGKVSEFIVKAELYNPISIYVRVIKVDEGYDTGHGNYFFFDAQGDVISENLSYGEFVERENKFEIGSLVYYVPDMTSSHVRIGRISQQQPSSKNADIFKLTNSDNVYTIYFDNTDESHDHAHPIEDFLYLVTDEEEIAQFRRKK
jgi:hypothetical protein